MSFLKAKSLQAGAHTHPPKPVFARNINLNRHMIPNYSKALMAFATSSIAVYYLEPALQREGITLDDFVSFVNKAKQTHSNIVAFRKLLLIGSEEEVKTVACKVVFRMISEVFIKYFSVNWIMHSRVTQKLMYLKFRSKMLRRIQNPELFTYVRRRVKKRE